LLPLSRFDEALAECDIAVKLDPLSSQVSFCTPWVHMFQGKAELALSEFRKLQAERPNEPVFFGATTIAAIHAGREAEMIAMVEQTKVDVPRLVTDAPVQAAFLAYAYGRVGRTADALEIERGLKASGRTRYLDSSVMCLVYAGLGKLDEARAAA